MWVLIRQRHLDELNAEMTKQRTVFFYEVKQRIGSGSRLSYL
jgi:hypothetical protein